GGYNGYNGLFGAKNVDPVIKPGAAMTDLGGNVIQDASGHVGFPGFDGMEATVSLSWVAQMQEAGIPVTYAYVSDAHDDHGTAGNIHFAFGPGEDGYIQQLQNYDLAFQRFFDRLAADGINKSNTLFVFTVDEGDHFVGDRRGDAGALRDSRRLRVHPAAHEPELRLEPRRHPGRDRLDLGRLRRAGRLARGRRWECLDRPHRPATDDADAARPEGRLPDRRPRGDADPERERRAREPARPSPEPRDAGEHVQAADGIVR